MSKITIFMFDLDGTLIDSNAVIVEAWLRQARKHTITISQEQIEQHIIGVSYKHTLNALFSHFLPAEQEAIHDEVDAFEEVAPTELLPGAKEFLTQLKADGKRIGLVTSSWRAKIDHVIAQHGLDMFEYIVCRTDVTHGKPHPEPFLKALALFGVKADEAVVFEDSIGGIAAAQQAGIKVVVVGQGAHGSAHTNHHGNEQFIRIPDFRDVSFMTRI